MTRRIAILFEYPTLNGGERSMLQVLEVIDRTQFDIVALAPATGRLADALHQYSIQHVPVELRDDQGVRLPRATAADLLVDTVQHQSLCLLHANSLAMGRLTGAIRERVDVPCVAHLRDIIGLSGAAIDDLNRNDALIAVSQATKQHHVQQGLDTTRTSVIYNGVDCESFRPRPRTGELCRELRIPESSFLLLTIGQVGLRKAQDVLAAAAPQITERVPESHFILVGERNSSKAESIAFEKNIGARFADAGISDRFHCLGNRDDVPKLMNEADLLVHPAKQEPLGRVLLEAAASGLPIVATNVGGTSEILKDGQTARLVEAGDAVALAVAVVTLALDKRRRAQFASAARDRVYAHFTPAAATQNLLACWTDLIQQSTNQRIE